MSEEWRPIVGYEDKYQISSLGRIRRISGLGGHRAKGKDGTLTTWTHRYELVGLSLNNGRGGRRTHVVHQLVAEAFLGRPQQLNMQVNHKNGVKTDNRLENLEYITASENKIHAIKVLGIKFSFGEKHVHCKLTDAQVLEIIRRYHSGETAPALGKEFGVWPQTIQSYVYAKKRKYLTVSARCRRSTVRSSKPRNK